MSQLTLSLPTVHSYRAEDFIVSECNDDACRQAEHWQDWHNRRLVVIAPPASGKTHLAHIWAQAVGAEWIDPATLTLETLPDITASHAVLDGLEQVQDEAALFHLLQRMAGGSTYLLVTSATPLTQINFRFPDVSSRLMASSVAHITPPDDTLLAALLAKLFSDRQLVVGSEVIDFLVTRLERSFAATYAAVETLDKEALSQRKNITIPFVKQVMQFCN